MMKEAVKDIHMVVYLDAPTKAKLDELKTEGYTISALVRKWINNGLQNMGKVR